MRFFVAESDDYFEYNENGVEFYPVYQVNDK